MPNRFITKNLLKITSKTNVHFRNLVLKFCNIQNKFIFKKIEKLLNGKSILDIGTGIGGLANFLSEKGYEVSSIDVDNTSFFVNYPTRI